MAASATVDALAFDPVTMGVTLLDFVGDGMRVAGNGYVAEFSSTRHHIPTLGAQVTMGGSRVVYSADTGPGWLFPTTFHEADAAIVECTLETRDESSLPDHLDAREAADLVSEMAPLSALITHVPPSEHGDRRRDLIEQYAPETQILLARTGLTLEIGRDRAL